MNWNATQNHPQRPTLRQLQYFVAVADHGAFGNAAKGLAVSQPSLSKLVSSLEEDIGGALFERTTRKVFLTPLGARLLPKARLVLQEVREFRALAVRATGLFGDRLSIGVLPSIGAYFMPIVSKRLHADYPDLRLIVREGSTSQLLEMLATGALDAVIATPSYDPEFEAVPLFSETLWICAPEEDPLSQAREPIRLEELKDRAVLTLTGGFTLTDIVEQLAEEAGAYISRDYQGGTLDGVRQMSVMGAGIAVLPSLYALAEAVRDPDFIVRRIDHPKAKHDIALMWRRSSASRTDFVTLSEILVSVKASIREARSDRFK